MGGNGGTGRGKEEPFIAPFVPTPAPGKLDSLFDEWLRGEIKPISITTIPFRGEGEGKAGGFTSLMLLLQGVHPPHTYRRPMLDRLLPHFNYPPPPTQLFEDE